MILTAANAEEKATLLAHLCERIGELPHDLVGSSPFEIVGAVRNGQVQGVVIFLNYRRQSIEFHLCGEPGWMTRGDIKHLFRYVFDQIKCLRLWCVIRRNNKKARVGVERLGFRVLGVADDEFGEGKDGIIYSMTRAQCRWIR